MSLNRRNGIAPGLGCLIWLRHVLDAEAETRNMRRAVLNWDDFLGDRRGALERLGVQLDLAWPRWSDTALAEIDEFVSADLKHQSASADDLRVHPAVGDLVRDTNAAMIELAEDPSDGRTWRKLDDARTRFEDAAEIFGPAMFETEEETRGLRSLAKYEREERASQLTALQDGLAAQFAAARDEFVRQLAAVPNGLARQVAAERDNFAGQLAAVQNGLARKVAAERDNFASQLAAERDNFASGLAAVHNGLASQVGAERDNFASQLAAERDSFASQLAAVQNGLARQLDALLAERDARLAEKDVLIADKNRLITVQERQISRTEAALADHEREVANTKVELAQKEAFFAEQSNLHARKQVEQEEARAAAEREAAGRIARLSEDRDFLARYLSRTFHRPWRPFKHHVNYQLLRSFSALTAPFSERMASRLARSAQKRNPSRFDIYLPGTTDPAPPLLVPAEGRQVEKAQPSPDSSGTSENLRRRLELSGLFDPSTYLEMHPDLMATGVDAWEHFLHAGLKEGRRFTTSELFARALSRLNAESQDALWAARQALAAQSGDDDILGAAAPVASSGARIGVFCNSHGNFFMQEIANLVHWQLSALNFDSQLRTEKSDLAEVFDIRIFVAPHEFFWLGQGENWRRLVKASGTVLFNVEQVQTAWFCKGLPFLLEAPLVLDINFQSAILLRRMGCNAIHYMPPYLQDCSYTRSQPDVSEVELVRGYEFSKSRFDWTKHKGLSDRPIDIIFVGAESERRLKAIERLRELTDKYRFVCVYSRHNSPIYGGSYGASSPEINCALAQRSKIVLNVHRDWIGYFEWSRIVMRGFWQGACVVSDPCLPDPVFSAGRYFLEENSRHLPELIRWLLGTAEGRAKMDEVAAAGYDRARSPAARTAMLVPMLSSLRDLVVLSGAQA